MSTPIVATGAAALGFYVWIQRWQQCGYAGVADLPIPLETHAHTEEPPTTWSETLYLFKEALRYVYQETFGRWHAIDLFFGLAYLSRRPTHEYPAADIAAAGRALHDEQMQPQAAQDLIQQLQEVKRYMLYCQGLKHHKPELQLKHWRITTGLEPEDILSHSPTAGLLRPAYVIFLDRASHKIILCVRGTHSRSDMFTSLTGTVKPHHAVTPDGVSLGYSHLGMLAAARWLLGKTKATLIEALEEHPGYQLRVIGHSMGGGTAAMLTMMMREKVPELSDATAWAIACPACMTLDLAASCAPFVTTLVHGTDVVPTFSSGAIDRLRDEVTQSSWFAEFQSDVRQRLATNFGASVRALRLSSATQWTQRNIIHTAATSFRSCYSRPPRSCYSRVSRSALSAASVNDHASPPVTPQHSAATAAPQHRSTWGFHILSSRHQHGPPAADGSNNNAMSAAALHSSAPASVDASVDDEGSALLARGQHASPFQWLRVVGSRGRRPGIAAAASSADGLRVHSSDADDSNRPMPTDREAALVERALQACLMAADSGQLEPPAAAAASDHQGAGTVSAPAAAYATSGSSAAGRGAALASNFVKAASKVVLRTKRPAAPGKKDDDEACQPPLQQSRSESTRQQRAAHTAAPAAAGGVAAAAAGGGVTNALNLHVHLPISTGASSGPTAGSTAAEGPAGAAAAAAAGSSSSGGGGGGVDSDPAAAASSAGKPRPASLRSRKGWAWGGVLAAGPGGRGWVADDDAGRRSSLTGSLAYLGQTVGHTGRLMVETTGNLLKSSNALFHACAAPAHHQAAAAAAAAAAAGDAQADPEAQPTLQLSQQQQQQQLAGASQSSMRPSTRSGIVTAPSSGAMDRDAEDSAFGVALAASLAEDDGESTDSDSDPDLQEGLGGDDAAFSLLDQPGLRGNISALVAAVSADATAVGNSLARVQQEEDRAAEQLLRDMGCSASETHLHRMAQQQQEASGAAGRRGPHSHQQQQSTAATQPHGSLQRDSPITSAQGQSSPSKPADGTGSGDGGSSSSSRDKAAERLARRRMYPAGRVLHLMPRFACPQLQADQQPDAAAAAADGIAIDGSGTSSRVGLALTAAQGSVGLGDDYVLLEVPNADVYGRVKLCPSMVRDHFIPSYLRALDSVLGQLQHAAAAAATAPGKGPQDLQPQKQGPDGRTGISLPGRGLSAGEVLLL